MTGEGRTRLLAWNTTLLALGVCAVAMPIGVALAALLTRTNVPGRRVASVIVCSLLFMPLYLQAAAWQAAFGLGGWATTAMGSFGEPLLVGWWGAIWIHAMAATPWVTLIVGLGLVAVPGELEELASLDASPLRVLTGVTLRYAAPSLGVALLWILVSTAGDMTVADVFQIRTYAEEVYIGYALGDDLVDTPLGVLPGIALIAVLATAAAVVCLRVLPRGRQISLRKRIVFDLGRWRWPAAVALSLLLAVLVAVPLLGLIHQAGVPLHEAGGSTQLQWSLGETISAVARSPIEFRRELGWTFLIGSLAATAAWCLAIALAWWACESRRGAVIAVAVAAICLAVPGPMTGLGISRMLTQPDLPLLIDLRDRSIFSPWLAQTIRCLPLCILVSWFALRSVPEQTLDRAKTEGLGYWRRLWSIAMPQRRAALIAAWLIGFVVATGDAAATAGDLVAPPGVDLMSRRIAGMLHSAIDTYAAGICLFNLLLFTAMALLTMWLFRRQLQRNG